jgi:hypothetical protein
MTIKCDRKYGATLDQGSVEHGITDKQGRSVGYTWKITEITYVEKTADDLNKEFYSFYPREEGQQMNVFQMWGTPTRNGKGYGPSSNYTEFNTLEEARRATVKRIFQAEKRDTKKFRKEVAA